MKKYIITVVSSVIVFVILLLVISKMNFSIYHFANTSFVVAAIYLIFGLLVFVANNGVFKPVTYATKRMLGRNSELAYKEHSKKIKVYPFLHFVIVGGVYFALTVILMLCGGLF